MIGRQFQFITLQPPDAGLRVLGMAGAARRSATCQARVTRHNFHAADATTGFPRRLRAATMAPIIEPNTTVQPIHNVI